MQPAATDADDIVFEDVRMRFGGRTILDGLRCAFPRGRVSVILGGSGMGKTTLLRLVGGLVHAQSGRILVRGRDVVPLSERQLREVRADVGMMFQNGALLDSLTVFDNLALPLRERGGLAPAQVAEKVRATLAAVGMKDAETLLPRQLSGGMTKRAALARAILKDPHLLLCDEPFSGLDPISTRRIEELLVRLNRERGMTVVAVSHDMASTFRMADHIVLLLPEGVFQGTPEELRANPNPAVTAFLDPEAAWRLAEGVVERAGA